jgi:hypothetical protein
LLTHYKKRLADALAIAACENAFGALPFFTSPQIVDDIWLRLLLDGLAHYFSSNGRYYTNEVVITPFVEWIDRGNDLTEGWKTLLRESLESQKRVSQDEEDFYPSILWINSSPDSVRQLSQTFFEVADRLESRYYDTSLIRGMIEYLQTYYPRYFAKKNESVE